MTIAIAIVTMVGVALLLASTGVYWATHESDAVSVERQARSAQHAMEISAPSTNSRKAGSGWRSMISGPDLLR